MLLDSVKGAATAEKDSHSDVPGYSRGLHRAMRTETDTGNVRRKSHIK